MSRTVLIGEEVRALEAQGVDVVLTDFEPAAVLEDFSVPVMELSDYDYGRYGGVHLDLTG